jgi:hypothetical protein
MSLGGRHGHTIRRLKRRLDAVLEKERERRRPLSPPPPPINEEHAALRRQIAELYRIFFDDPEVPEGLLDPEDPNLWEGFEETLDERVEENPELADVLRTVVRLRREEDTLLAENGVDYRPYEVYRLE